MRREHKPGCSARGPLRDGQVPKCNCGAGKQRIVARHDQSFYTAAVSDGQASLGDGNYRRMPLHSES